MSRLFQWILDLLFPPKCIFCRRVLPSGQRDICGQCMQELPCSLSRSGEFFTDCVAPLHYEGVVRKSILRYKFHDMSNYAGAYGKLMADCVRNNYAGEYDLISWVPVSPSRKKSRGYDQAMLLAMAVALELEDVAVETLRKIVDNPAQSGLENKSQRKANVLGVYEVVDAELITGKRILLIDDVMTTGATLSECSRELLTAGAADVLCATLAMTAARERY